MMEGKRIRRNSHTLKLGELGGFMIKDLHGQLLAWRAPEVEGPLVERPERGSTNSYLSQEPLHVSYLRKTLHGGGLEAVETW